MLSIPVEADHDATAAVIVVAQSNALHALLTTEISHADRVI